MSTLLPAAQFREQSHAKMGLMPIVSVRNQSCPNESCAYFGRVCAGNVTVHSRRYQRFMCKHCAKTWVAHRTDLTYRLHADPRKLHETILMSRAGQSVRTIARSLGVSPSTVQRWKLKEPLRVAFGALSIA